MSRGVMQQFVRIREIIMASRENSARRIKFLYRRIVADLCVKAQFRALWFWLVVIGISLLWVVSTNVEVSPVLWIIFGGLIPGIWLTKIGDSGPVFVRSYGDSVYMTENHSFWFSPNKWSCLEDRILRSLFGISLGEIKAVYHTPSSKSTLSIENVEIVELEGQKTKYLKFAGSDYLYAIPDRETYERFCLWVKKREKQVIHQKFTEHEIKKYGLGFVVTPASLWSDPQVLNATKEWKAER